MNQDNYSDNNCPDDSEAFAKFLNSQKFFSINNVFCYKEKPMPGRCVMIPVADMCQFCKNPVDDIFISFVLLENNLGFVSCKLCRDSMDKRVEEYYIEAGANDLATLLGKNNINVKRSSGVMDNGWTMPSEFKNNIYLAECSNGYKKKVRVIGPGKIINKWVDVEELIEWNK